MVYITEDVKKYAERLGIDENAKDKLYKTAKNMNRFFKEQSAQMQIVEENKINNGGAAEYDKYDDKQQETEQLQFEEEYAG